MGAKQILILGGGFAGVYTARHLEKLLANSTDVEITLISRDNFLLMTPLVFEICSGELQVRDCSIPIREFLRSARFVEAAVERIDLENRVVHVSSGGGIKRDIAYDHLALTLGGVTNTSHIPGAELALTFKTLADAIVLRNHAIERLERADAETDAQQRRRDLTFAIIGGGLVGVEIFGELAAFFEDILRYYPRVRPEEIRLHLLQAGPRIIPEVPANLSEYAVRILSPRIGVDIRVNCPVLRITPGQVHLKDEVIEASTILLSAGIVPSPVLRNFPVEKDHRGKIFVEATMRHKHRPELWAAGDCASIPGPDGKPYPELAQHAMRQAKVLAANIHAAVTGGQVKPFVYQSKGIMASLGRRKALAAVRGIPLRGFIAWWIRRTYYLLVTPRMAQRIQLVVDWTMALFLRPSLTKLDLHREREMLERDAAGAVATTASEHS